MFGCCAGRAGFTPPGGSGPGAGVTSFAGRTGVVSPQAGDYSSDLIGNDSAVTGSTVTAALNALAAAIVAVTVATAAPISGDGSGGNPITLGIADKTHWKGGLREVADLVERNAVPAGNRDVGMTVYEVDTDQMWRLIGGTGNGNWVDVTVYPVSNTTQGVVPQVGAVSTILQSTGSAASWVSPLTYASTFLSPTITQTATAGATGQRMTVSAQNAATTGGALWFVSGTGGTSPGELAGFAGASQVFSFTRSNSNDFVALGLNPASQGRLRLPPGASIWSREFGFGSDIEVYTSGTANNIQTFGSANSASTKINGPNGGGVGIQTSGTDRVTFSSTAVNLIVPLIQVGTAAASTGFTFNLINSNAGSNPTSFFRIRSMGTTSGNTNGNNVELEGGRLNGTGVSGGVTLKLNQDDTQANMWIMAQVAHIASGANQRRVVSFCFPGTSGGGITATQMPANSGDLVAFFGNANTVPSADAVGGFTMYSDGAKPAWRFNGTNLRLNGTAAGATAGGGAAPPATVLTFLDVQVNGTQGKVPVFAA